MKAIKNWQARNYLPSAYSAENATSVYVILYKNGSAQELLSQYAILTEMDSREIEQSGHVLINGRKWMTMTVSSYGEYNSIYFIEVSVDTVLATIIYSNTLDMSKTIEALLYKASFGK